MAKGNFLAHMSHEVRTPLSAIIGLTELTLETELDDDQRMCLEMIIESSRSLLSILNDVLDLSKIEAGKLEFSEDVFNVRSLAESCLKMFSRSAEQRGIDLILDRSEDLPELVVGDPDRLRQVLVNLLSNAVKFTTRGFVKLSAAAEEHDKPGELKIRFSVLDTGKGIPPAMQKNVFETFVQAGRSFEGGSRGFGLGLAISDNLVKLMGGRLELESREGQGSEFSFSAVFKAPAAMEARRRAREIPELKRGLKVLVAEDEDTNADFVCRLLAKYGHKPERAQNGAEVLNMLGRGGYDLVLMDIQMPEMDGMEAASRIRSGEDGIDPHIPIIALTAHAMRGDKETFLAAGMDGYVPKPVDSSELLAAMTEVMGADEG
jgi:CheY-like chemotaxis protein/anti-sigma regulatory factor (Ser/Thr protein kinase)